MTPAGPADPAPPKSGYLPTLDGWRAIAVFMVIVSHTAASKTTITWYQGLGGFGVSIFFALSGFLICSRLLAERDRTGRIDLVGFYVRRVFRILPPAWTYLAAVGGLAAAGIVETVSWGELRACVFMYRNYYTGADAGLYTAHFWSLTIEEHFYLLFPVLLLLAGPRRAFWLFPPLCLAVAVWRTRDARQRYAEPLIGPIESYFRTDTRLDALLWGCWAAVLVWRFRGRLHPWAVRAAGLVAAGLIVQQIQGWGLLHGYLVALFIPAAALPFVVTATVLCPRDPLGRVLEFAPLRWVGRLSYSLYLWQQLFFIMWSPKEPELVPLQQWPWQWPALFACATASHYLVERPLTRLGHRLATPATPGRV